MSDLIGIARPLNLCQTWQSLVKDFKIIPDSFQYFPPPPLFLSIYLSIYLLPSFPPSLSLCFFLSIFLPLYFFLFLSLNLI